MFEKFANLLQSNPDNDDDDGEYINSILNEPESESYTKKTRVYTYRKGKKGKKGAYFNL